MISLQDKVVIITGGGRGIGFGLSTASHNQRRTSGCVWVGMIENSLPTLIAFVGLIKRIRLIHTNAQNGFYGKRRRRNKNALKTLGKNVGNDNEIKNAWQKTATR